MSASVFLSVTAVVMTYIGVGRFRRWAERRQLLDLPNERSSHTRPTPRGGGVIIVAVTLICGAMLPAIYGRPSLWPAYVSYAAGALLVAAVSWLDDLRSLPSSARFAAHLAGAAAAIAGLGYWHVVKLPVVGELNWGGWGAAVTVVWIVGLTNAFNFMDGTDGIAGAQALVAGIGWALLGWQSGYILVAGIGLLIAGSSFGFLVHNWPPARIFMGDVGSAFLGYTLAVLPVMYSFFSGGKAGSPVVGLLFVWPFVFDTSFTFMRRLFRHEKVFAAHRSHLYQRMTSAFHGHAKVALLYSGLALTGVLLAQVWSTRVADGAVNSLLALPFLCFGLWFSAIIQEQRMAERSESNVPVLERRP
jgi:UDP-N-acetylmuramyl pentapeptide phosphotransferase/UDP-N-acetylglucosamine-1-phosphate transferase